VTRPRAGEGIERHAEPTPRDIVLLNHYERLSPRIRLELETLVQAGHRVHVMLWRREAEALPEEVEPAASIRVIDHDAPRGGPRVVTHLPGLYRKLAKTLEGVPCHAVLCTHLMILPFAVRWGKSHGARVLYDAHEYYLEELRERLPRPLRLAVRLLKWIEAWCVRRVEGVLTVDSRDGWLERRYRRQNPNTVVLWNVPLVGDGHDAAPPYPSSIGSSTRAPELAMVGTLDANKGALVALDSLGLLREEFEDLRLLIVGNIRPSVGDAFRARLRSHGLEASVEFIDWLPYDRLVERIRSCRAGLALYQPTRRYGLLGPGNARKIFTYMHAGIPVIAPAFGEVGAIVESTRCGLRVDTTDPQAVANAVRQLLLDEGGAVAMGLRGRRDVMERHSWEVEQRKLLELFDQALAR
jgi:glycosyltransferase involved in cell wall biosynthesis